MATPTYTSLLEEARQRYMPGGAYAKGELSQLERTRKRTIAGAEQSLVSSGLYGTTVRAGLPGRFEEEVGEPTRARIEETRTGRLTDIDSALANILATAEQGTLNRQTQLALANMQTPSMASQGLNVLGEPMPGTEAYYRKQLAQLEYQQALAGLSGAGGGGVPGGSSAFPNLYGSAGGGAAPQVPNPYSGAGGQTPWAGVPGTSNISHADWVAMNPAAAPETGMTMQTDPATGVTQATTAAGVGATVTPSGSGAAFNEATQYSGAYGKISNKMQYDPNNPDHRALKRTHPYMFLG